MVVGTLVALQRGDDCAADAQAVPLSVWAIAVSPFGGAVAAAQLTSWWSVQ